MQLLFLIQIMLTRAKPPKYKNKTTNAKHFLMESLYETAGFVRKIEAPDEKNLLFVFEIMDQFQLNLPLIEVLCNYNLRKHFF